MRLTFRYDDVSLNTDPSSLASSVAVVRSFAPSARILACISPLVHSTAEGERIFPRIFKAYSDQRCFYRVDKCGIPPLPDGVARASHGLFHVDHRLLSPGAQEMSIIASCALVGCSVFVPPFNKWNPVTEQVCRDNGIELIRFEDGWRSAECEPWDETHPRWYLHHRNVSEGAFRAWFAAGRGRIEGASER